MRAKYQVRHAPPAVQVQSQTPYFSLLLHIAFIMVWVTGGYILDFSQAKAWAQRKYPEIQFFEDVFIPNEIHNYFKDNNMQPACIAVTWKGEDKTYFVTHGKVDGAATRRRYQEFSENARAQAIRKMLFDGLEDEFEFLKDIQFVTIPDPFNNGKPY
ncbi:hypothetical protein BV22DRAFT_1198204 [Leucogyrophana mollusca]|uniref:Uncharacterized protein n=1 Tax=Leucogyrophana mollusca TaxID=85980 RepID=A0ACB8B7H3_9AGAM|nr:hypothetical protein BV22DRAFT_1198204 [Leucogyrophana mollusca]